MAGPQDDKQKKVYRDDQHDLDRRHSSPHAEYRIRRIRRIQKRVAGGKDWCVRAAARVGEGNGG